MNVEETGRLLAVLTTMWPDHPIADPEALVVGWQMALSDVPYEDAMTAAAAHIKTSPFFPRPSELRAIPRRRLDPADYRGDAYLDVPWMRHGKLPTAPAIGDGR